MPRRLRPRATGRAQRQRGQRRSTTGEIPRRAEAPALARRRTPAKTRRGPQTRTGPGGGPGPAADRRGQARPDPYVLLRLGQPCPVRRFLPCACWLATTWSPESAGSALRAALQDWPPVEMRVSRSTTNVHSDTCGKWRPDPVLRSRSQHERNGRALAEARGMRSIGRLAANRGRPSVTLPQRACGRPPACTPGPQAPIRDHWDLCESSMSPTAIRPPSEARAASRSCRPGH